jgi:hypothetical protein
MSKKANIKLNKIQETMELNTMISDTIPYSEKTNKELIAICKSQNIHGYSKKKKNELIELIESHVKPVIENTFISHDSIIPTSNTKRLKVATLFSGIGAFEHALQRLNIDHDIVFACDIDNYVKTSYFANYKIKGLL